MRCLCALHLLFFTLCATTPAIAQSTDATVSGLVLDPSGKVIPIADIEILNESTGVLYSGKTNETGIYTVSILPPGQYRIQVSKVGFKTIIKPGIVLNVQSAVALNFTLPIGATSETVTVDSGTSLINTTDASVSTVVDRTFVENIPLNGRSFQDLISMTPGVVTESPQTTNQSVGYNGDFSVNGQRTESNYYTVDGVSGNISSGAPSSIPQAASSGSIAASSALGTTQSLLSVDALQEFRVDGSTYSAEYGHSPGGQFSLVSRAGNDTYHGTLFDYLRNNAFDANDWFNDHFDKQISALRQNDFGGTFGGPVLLPRLYRGEKRTFFFVSYEGLRLIQPQAASIQYVPDASMRQSAPASLQSILNAYPIQNGEEVTVGCTGGATTAFPCPANSPLGTQVPSQLAEFIEPYSLPAQIDSTSIRLDHVLSPHYSTFFRLGYTPSFTSSRALSSVSQNEINTLTDTFGLNMQLAGSLSNEIRLGYSMGNSEARYSLDSFGGATPVNLSEATGAGSSTTAGAEFELYFPNVGATSLIQENPTSRGRQWDLNDTATLLIGKHQIKFGFDYRHIKTSLVSAFNPFSIYYFESPKAVLADVAQFAYVERQTSSTPMFNEFAAFIQDEWHVASAVNLSAGLRWEVDPPPVGQNGTDAYTTLGDLDQPDTLRLAPRGTPLWQTTWQNFAPRLGVAWTPHRKPGSETVIRSGGGVFFDTDDEMASKAFNGIGFFAYQEFANTPVPLTPSQIAFSPSANPPYTSTAVYSFPSHLQLPYTLQWNVSMEQAIGKSQSLTLSYVGANGRRLIQTLALSYSSHNTNFATIDVPQTGVSSNYQAMQVKFQRTVKHGVQALGSYTWSHSLDFGSDDASLPAIRGNSDFDVRSNAQIGIAWEIPQPALPKASQLLLQHWGLDARLMARSAFPVTLNGNALFNPVTGSEYSGSLDFVPGESLYLYNSLYPGGRIINRAAFSLPSAGASGDAPRNFVRGFGAAQLNIAARREFVIVRDLKCQFRAEAFNIANHPNFGYVDPVLSDATFGQATQTLNQSLGTVSALYQQGGARSMQFALKLLF